MGDSQEDQQESVSENPDWGQITDGQSLILQLQLQEYHHYQSMARGILGITLALGALSITAVSTFYLPSPEYSTNAADYQSIVEAIIFPIGTPTALLTAGMSLILVIIFGALALISLLLLVDSTLDVMIPRESLLLSSEVGAVTVESDDHINSNRDRLETARSNYTRGSLRLIFTVIFAGNALLIHGLVITQNIWMLFWLNTIFLLPTAVASTMVRSILGLENEDSHDKGYSLFVELMLESGDRWETMKVRSYERDLLALISLISLIVILSWVISSLVSIT